MNPDDSYRKLTLALKRRQKGATAADITAATALPLTTVRDLLPQAADEYSGHLQVTESGEILYTFPNGFTSRRRGFGVFIKRAAGVLASAIRSTLVFLFKIWIMITLIGYFVFFLALAAASVVLSVAAQSKSSNRRSAFAGPNLFGILWRFWFFNEMTRPRYGYGYSVPKKNKEKRPMHKAVFSFIFGDGDPNRDWMEKENKAVIAYIQANRGVISLAEYMAFSGKNSAEAEGSLMSFCVRFGGIPEATEEGTIVYRFDELLLRADSGNFAELSPPVKQLKTFSANTKTTNGWFIAINAVNLFFGSYFLYHSLQYQSVSFLYEFTHLLFQMAVPDPAAIIRFALGLAPFIFSLLFWIIPAIRRVVQSEENEDIRSSNFKRLGFSKIWSAPLNVKPGFLAASAAAGECRPQDTFASADRVIKDIGAVSGPEIEIGENGEAVYSFKELEREKNILNQYRSSLDTSRYRLGKIVFDTGE